MIIKKVVRKSDGKPFFDRFSIKLIKKKLNRYIFIKHFYFKKSFKIHQKHVLKNNKHLVKKTYLQEAPR